MQRFNYRHHSTCSYAVCACVRSYASLLLLCLQSSYVVLETVGHHAQESLIASSGKKHHPFYCVLLSKRAASFFGRAYGEGTTAVLEAPLECLV